MTTAEYYRMKAKECFDHALSASDKAEAQKWRERGREYGGLAIALDAETSEGESPPSRPPKEDHNPSAD
jgi:hypothetical protein